MRSSPLYFALAFFCGFRVSAEPIASTAAPNLAATPAPKSDEKDSASASTQEEGPPSPWQIVPINLGIVPGTASNGNHPDSVLNYVSLDLVYGKAGAVHGIQLSGGMNEVKAEVKGIQATAGLDIVHGDVSGVQAAIVNLVDGNVTGYQGATILNRVGGDFEGFQASSLGNLTTGRMTGVQTSSIYGRAPSVVGVQWNSIGVTDTLYGLQGGMVNYAKHMEGVQFGIVNISGGGDGPQIGLVNIRPDTRMYAEKWIDETMAGHIALNYGGPHWYTLVEGLADLEDPRTIGLGIGYGVRSASPVNIASFDVSTLALVAMDNDAKACHEDHGANCSVNLLLRSRLTLGRHVWKRLAFFGGASYNALFVPKRSDGARLLEPAYAYQYDPTDRIRLWPGVFVGMRI